MINAQALRVWFQLGASEKKSNVGITTGPNCWEINKDMRYSRHWYILPFLVNLLLLFSSSWLVSIVVQNVVEDMSFPLPAWMLFATIAVCAPPSLAISRLLPDPSIALAMGGLLTSAGLLWTGFETGPVQMISFCVLTGAGISLSVQAIGIVLSPFFLRENITASAGTLLLSAFVMLVLCPLITNAAEGNSSIFLYLCPMAFINSLVPILVYLHSERQSRQAKQGKLPYANISGDSSSLPEKFMKNDCEKEIICCDDARSGIQQLVSSDGWTVSLMSLFVWLTWGAGVDTTWLTLGWRNQYFNTPTGLATLQLILCFVLLSIKLCSEFSQPNISYCRVNLASNYMQLGLLGTAGVLLFFFPEHTQAFQNHLLFTAGCALQFDDLSDLYLVRNSGPPTSIFKYKLVTYHIGLNEQSDKSYSPLLIICCKMCHMLSLLLMSVLAMVLGVQIANILGYLSTLPPLTFIFSRGGLIVMSVAAICISLMRPNSWKGQMRHIMFL